jgi:hypothetical protein
MATVTPGTGYCSYQDPDSKKHDTPEDKNTPSGSPKTVNNQQPDPPAGGTQPAPAAPAAAPPGTKLETPDPAVAAAIKNTFPNAVDPKVDKYNNVWDNGKIIGHLDISNVPSATIGAPFDPRAPVVRAYPKTDIDPAKSDAENGLRPPGAAEQSALDKAGITGKTKISQTNDVYDDKGKFLGHFGKGKDKDTGTIGGVAFYPSGT